MDLLERLAKVAYEAMLKDARLSFRVYSVDFSSNVHKWENQSQTVRDAWKKVAAAIQEDLKAPEWPAVGDRYVLRMRDPLNSVGCEVTRVEKNEQGVWIVHYKTFQNDASAPLGCSESKSCTVLWVFQNDAQDYREWNSLGGDS